MSLTAWLQQRGISDETQANLLASIIAVLLLWALHWSAQRFLVARVKSPQARFSTKRVVRYLTVLAAVLLVGRIWYSGLHSIATLVGLVGAGVAIALKDPLANMAGFVFLIARHPFRVGDRIAIGPHVGDVTDIGLFQFQLHEIGVWTGGDSTTGRVLYVPNARVFLEPQINYDHGLPFLWDEVPVVVTFESNWEAAKALLAEVGARHAVPRATLDDEKGRRAGETGYFLLEQYREHEVLTAVVDHGVQLTVRYAVDPRRRRRTKMLIWEDVLRAFAARKDIDFAYPTYRRVDLEERRDGVSAPVARPLASATRET